MKERPADGTNDEDGEGCRNADGDHRADYGLDRDSHQKREYRTEQNDSRNNRELPGGMAAHAVTACKCGQGLSLAP